MTTQTGTLIASLITAGSVITVAIIGSRKVDEIHIMVNKRLTDLLKEVENLKKTNYRLKKTNHRLWEELEHYKEEQQKKRRNSASD